MMFHRDELTDDEARTLAKATIAKIRDQQRTEHRELTDLLIDIVNRSVPYGIQDGDFIASYILPTGPIHRAIKYLQEHGIATVAWEALSPDPLEDFEEQT